MKQKLALFLCCLLLSCRPVYAQIEIIGEVIKAAIMAADLAVQKVQTETIILQDAQKTLENAMQSLQLGAITEWVQRQKDLYSAYYQELWQVKEVFLTYGKVKGMVEKQALLVANYKRAYASFRQDAHFSPQELQHIYNVYNGILSQSISNIQQLGLVINAMVTQMEDGDRLRIIEATGRNIDKNYDDFQQFTQENILLSLQRSKSQQELGMIRALYGISP
jgi:hypothetical protein